MFQLFLKVINLNLFGYVVYLLITVIIIIYVGKICYTNGNTFIKNLIPEREELGQQINKLLLTGYYLLNIGYAFITIINWNEILHRNMLIETISYRTGIIVMLIAIIHYCNIYILTKYIHKTT